ncbi:hypothetical protein, partial [Streptomyces sp. DH12]|uniref:hypothetical protein n=1 Tax=Streptomyces sp. DH12 TaxID=2857010 RepID=UPI001E38C616
MIEELLAAFADGGPDAGPDEIADILWLAARVDAAHGGREQLVGWLRRRRRCAVLRTLPPCRRVVAVGRRAV